MTLFDFLLIIYISGDTAPVRYLSLKSLLPDTTGYMTYEGSTTHPGCWETAVWLILNKPIYITAREVNIDPFNQIGWSDWWFAVKLLPADFFFLAIPP